MRARQRRVVQEDAQLAVLAALVAECVLDLGYRGRVRGLGLGLGSGSGLGLGVGVGVGVAEV